MEHITSTRIISIKYKYKFFVTDSFQLVQILFHVGFSDSGQTEQHWHGHPESSLESRTVLVF